MKRVLRVAASTRICHPARHWLRDPFRTSSTTLTVPFVVRRERPVHDLRGSLVGKASVSHPFFASQLVVGEELKTLRDEVLSTRELLK